MLPSQIFAELDRFDDIDQHFEWDHDQYVIYSEAEEEFGDTSSLADLL